MDKVIWRTTVITVSESWTITWADGTEHRVVYRSEQYVQTSSSAVDDPQAPTDLAAIATDPDQSSDGGGGSA